MSNRRAFWIASLLSLSGCVADAGGDGAPRAEEVGEAQQALTTSTVASYTMAGGGGVHATNGKKIVFAGGVLHAVYAVGGVVKYTSSSDGVTWAAPFDVDTSSARQPTIAVSSSGTVGIAYLRNYTGATGEIYYRSKPSGGLWGTAVRVVTGFPGDGITPSMASEGTTMYLAWVNEVGTVVHAAFPHNLSASLATAEFMLTSTACETIYASLPSIAVSSGVVRIAAVEVSTPIPGCPGGLETRLRLSERTGSAWLDFDDIIEAPGYLPAHAVSMDAIPTGGTFVIGSSLGSETYFHKVTGVIGGPTVLSHTLATSSNHISVAARMVSCQERLRVAWSPTSSYGTASYRTALWSGVSPSWIEGAPVTMSVSGRVGTALIASKAVPLTPQTRFFYGYFEESMGGSLYTVRDAYETLNTPAPCE